MLSKKSPLGLYIHIPFCVKKCAYCDFLSMQASDEVQEKYIEALLKELDGVSILTDDYELQTIYLGGGTPSVLDTKHLWKILEKVQDVFGVSISRMKEVTLEVNPGAVSMDKWMEYQRMGIQRISMGLQSTHDDELKLLGRIHTYEQFLKNYYEAREAGFNNINIDLMSALPNQRLDKYLISLERVAKLLPEHISSYSLIIEEGTPFWPLYGENGAKEKELPVEELDRAMYEATKEVLSFYGYKRYEISNYARQGYESIHNTSYWTGIPYLGVGLGASSYLENNRYQNRSDMRGYLKYASDTEKRRNLVETLSKKDKMSEFMFLGLRRMCGVSMIDFVKFFGLPMEQVFGETLQKLEKEELIKINGDKVFLTDRGIDVSNFVFAEFLL
ncbi:MAG: oxygen-independent coproporphyrinogen III oxidase [Lachnospiraceae bacterium]|nr:oxygen-independent coproporphyrinogen III oxidase [Lachnospiraceae bacterium]